MEHLQLQMGIACHLRWLLMVVLAAALVWMYPEHAVSMFQRLWMFAAVLLYLWLLGALLGTLLGAPMARPRCPRCAGKLALRPGVTSCPSCNVSFDAMVQRDWPCTSTTRSPWLTRSLSLRMGQTACTALIGGCVNSPPVDNRSARGAGQPAVDEGREARALEKAEVNCPRKYPDEAKRVEGKTVYGCVER